MNQVTRTVAILILLLTVIAYRSLFNAASVVRTPQVLANKITSALNETDNLRIANLSSLSQPSITVSAQLVAQEPIDFAQEINVAQSLQTVNGVFTTLRTLQSQGALLSERTASLQYNVSTANTFQSVPIPNPAAQNYAGGVLAPNGLVYMIPRQATAVMIVNPNTLAIDVTSIQGLPSGAKYSGAAVAQNGLIYCFPFQTDNVLVIDPRDNSFFFLPVPIASPSYRGGTIAPNGMMYVVPNNSDRVIKIDPTNNTVTLIGPVLTGTNQYFGAFVGNDGLVYGVPFQATSFVRINPATDLVDTSIPVPAPPSGSSKFGGAVVGTDGFAYLVPNNGADYIGVFDAKNATTTYLGPVINTPAGSIWRGGSLGLDGSIYMTPANDDRFIRITFPVGLPPVLSYISRSSTETFFGSVMTPSGRILAVPHGSSHIGVLTTFYATINNVALDPLYNKF